MSDIGPAVGRAWSGAVERARTDGFLLLQQAAAATAAWVVATHVVTHHHPFFAPVAAVVALNAPLGERGGNTLRLLQGVVIGIVAGEVALGILGATSGSLFLATLAGMATSRALGGTPLVLAQAATAAILTVAAGDEQIGPDRLIDALIGGGVALLFTQVLFTPEPVRLLRRAESRVLTDIAGAFDLTARALSEEDRDLANRAVDGLRDLRERLVELGRAKTASKRVPRRSAAWRSQRDPVVKETEEADQLDLLAASSLMLVRNATKAAGDEREVLAPAIRELAAEARELAQNPGDRGVRQRAADGVLNTTRQLQSAHRVQGAAPDSALAAAAIAMRSAAGDIMVFAGVDSDEAERALHHHDANLDVPSPAPTPRTPFKRPRPPWRRIGQKSGA
ncbi:MAG TPA: FUSC family protein [Thermoleophilaceae bacterium]|nr:FUSC family protein [Thermoleophilaceae bacterium]